MILEDSKFLESLNILDFGYTQGDQPLSFSHYEDWVLQGHHAPLEYLADHRKDLRKSLRKVFPPFQSALVFLFSYSKEKQMLNQFYESSQSNGLKIASYALGFEGEDYHQQVAQKLNLIKEHLLKENPRLEVMPCLDVHPVLERDLAYRSGLGWFGKNSMLISQAQGSFFILGSLLLSQKLDLKQRPFETDHCGQCQRCVEACPTDAIDPQSRTLRSSLCLSTFTIELFKGNEPPPKGIEKGDGEIYGCDICQDVCPWNEKPLNHHLHSSSCPPLNDHRKEQTPWLQKSIQFFLARSVKEIINELEIWSNKRFKREFKNTPMARTGRRGLLRNLKVQQKILKTKKEDTPVS